MLTSGHASVVCGHYDVEGFLECKSTQLDKCKIIISKDSFSEKKILIKNANSVLSSLDFNYIKTKIKIISGKLKLPQAVIEEVPLRILNSQGSFNKTEESACEE